MAPAARQDQPEGLQVSGLTFGYAKGEPPVLQDWSAQFEPGTMTALTGPSGCGKSTLLYLLGLMLTPDAGDITVHGQKTTALSDAAKAGLRAAEFGFVFQDSALDPTRTVLDNITETALYRNTPRENLAGRGSELMERFGVAVPPHRKPGQISGGQAQRIALCRALLHSPAIVLADEPTGNLDPETAEVVVETLHEHARRGATVLIVTHSREVAHACDHMVPL